MPPRNYHAGLDTRPQPASRSGFLEAERRHGDGRHGRLRHGRSTSPTCALSTHAGILPRSIEAYWQEIGRAGRDGQPAEGITLYGSADMAWAGKRIEGREAPDEVRQVQSRKLRQFYAMLEGTTCRAAAVRRYFGEEGVAVCGVCDICTSPPKGIDATEAAQKALSAAHRLGGRFGRGRLIDHLLGKTKDVTPQEAQMSTFGIGSEFSPVTWRDLLDTLVFEGLLRERLQRWRALIGLGEVEGVKAVYRGERQVQACAGAGSSTRPRAPARRASVARARP